MGGVQALISLSREIDAATQAGDSTKYPAAHVTTLAGNDQWSSAEADPTKHIMADIEQVRSAIGRARREELGPAAVPGPAPPAEP